MGALGVKVRFPPLRLFTAAELPFVTESPVPTLYCDTVMFGNVLVSRP
jgi:hypothetical protein